MKVDLETASLLVSGIRDQARERGVCSALESIHGVHGVSPLPGHSTMVVRFDPTRVVPEQLRTAVRVMGCRVESMLLGGDRDTEVSAAVIGRGDSTPTPLAKAH